MNKQLSQLMEKPVTRRQFLAHLGVIVIGLLGFNSVISLLTDERHLKLSSRQNATHGFGAGKFGV